jgi:hypothetical protein
LSTDYLINDDLISYEDFINGNHFIRCIAESFKNYIQQQIVVKHFTSNGNEQDYYGKDHLRLSSHDSKEKNAKYAKVALKSNVIQFSYNNELKIEISHFV